MRTIGQFNLMTKFAHRGPSGPFHFARSSNLFQAGLTNQVVTGLILPMKHIVGPLARFLFVLFVLLALVPAQCSQKRLKKKLSKKGDLDAELAMGYSWRNHKLYAKQDGNIEWMVGNGQKVSEGQMQSFIDRRSLSIGRKARSPSYPNVVKTPHQWR